MADSFKKVKIHTGVVKRINKEQKMYEKQYNSEVEKVQKMKSNCAPDDEEMKANIKKMEEVANETKAMVPDTERRLRENTNTLNNHLLDISKPEAEWSEDEKTVMKNAKDILAEIGAAS